jgi:hypothetical protein
MLTPHDVAITRASEAATKIDGYLEGMRKSGQLQQFNSQFKLRRMAATARGEGFMSYASALSRLRRALIPLLVGGRTVGPVQSLFAEIFDA